MSTNLDIPDGGSTPSRRPAFGLGADGGAAGVRPRRKIPSQSIVLLLVLSVSAAALYGMRRYGMKSGISFTQVNVDYKEMDAKKAQTYERIMADLARIQKPMDVALGEFKQSPFMQPENEQQVNPNIEPPEPGASADEIHRAAAVTALSSMKLQSIIGNVARIDGQTVRVGDQFAEIFTVTKIEGQTVSFEAYGEPFTLSMQPAKPRPTGGAPTQNRPFEKNPRR